MRNAVSSGHKTTDPAIFFPRIYVIFCYINSSRNANSDFVLGRFSSEESEPSSF